MGEIYIYFNLLLKNNVIRRNNIPQSYEISTYPPGPSDLP